MNVTPHMPHGHQMPAGWQAQSAARKAAAEASYLDKLQNAWKAPLTKTNDSEIFNARLTNDSRTDSLRMVVDNEEEEVWQEAGATVRIRKNRKIG